MTADDVTAAVRDLTAAGLTPSEAVGVVRGARRLPGPVAASLPFALDVLADGYAADANRMRHAAARLRGASAAAGGLAVAA